MHRCRAQPFELLVVEDSPTEAQLLTLCPHCRPHVVGDGHTALHFLRREAGFQGAPTPSLVLLDLHLPHLSMTGLDVLAAMKSDPHLHLIPVVFTGSAQLACAW